MKIERRDQLLDLANKQGLQWIVNFHNYVGQLLKRRLGEVETSDQDKLDKRFEIDALHDYDRLLQINTFLMMYSHVEEWLHHVWRVFAKDIALDDSRGSIRRYTSIMKAINVDVGANPWQFLVESEYIRNCLLHANGRISLCAKPKQIKGIIQKHAPELEVKNDRLVVCGTYLKRFQESLLCLFDLVHDNGAQQIASGDSGEGPRPQS
jgi:hypothetical protein